MSSKAFDVIVIGGGPGGYVAAIRAAQLGFSTAVVERAHLGGICLNWGCIPTKALLRTSEVYHLMQHAADFGLSAEKIGYDVKAIVKRSRDVAARLSGGVGMLMKKHKITVIEGEAKLAKGKDAPKVVVGKDSYDARHVILATGARARTVPQAGWSPMATRSGPIARRWCRKACRNRCWSSDRARSGSSLPASTTRWAPM